MQVRLNKNTWAKRGKQMHIFDKVNHEREWLGAELVRNGDQNNFQFDLYFFSLSSTTFHACFKPDRQMC